MGVGLAAALGEAADSLPAGPPAVHTKSELAQALATATPGPDGWIRGIGYHESIAGELDRTALGVVVPGIRARAASQPRDVDPQYGGARADLCVLSAPPAAVLAGLDAAMVAAAIVGGRLLYAVA